jgi:hypothetical protein
LANLLSNDFFYSAKIGFEFEFFTNLNRNDVANKLGKILGKKILVFKKYHSNFVPTKDTFKLEPDYSGGSKMVELITGPLPYFEAIPILIRTLKWIDENGYTNKKSAFQFGLSFDNSIYPLIPSISHLNKLKFLLGFDEEFIYTRFPERRDSLYAKSIKRIVPSNRFIDPSNLSYIDKNLFDIPLEKNMGINFLKMPEGYIEIRYLGGSDYQKRYSSIKDVIDYILTYTLRTLESNEEFTENDLKILKETLKEIYKNSSTFIDSDTFQKNYPHLKLLVDLKYDPQIIKSFFINFRDVLYDLIVDNGIKEGLVNYDSSLGKYQLKDTETSKAYLLSGYDLLDSTLSGNILNCRLFGCNIKDSTIEDSDIVTNNQIDKSKIINSDFMYTNSANDCYIDNKNKEINGEVYGGIIRSGFIGKLSSVSNETEVVKDAQDDKKMKGNSRKIEFPNRNDNKTLSKSIRFSNVNFKPSGIPGTDFKKSN